MSQRIRQVSQDVIHRISSGQVVVDLATAVKELVENALDARATNIEVKLKEYGSELIEVADDGSGVFKADLEGLALKHHTSKFVSIDDLQTLASFGFRGEALSSLCAMSELMVTTRTADDVTGSRVMYDGSGRISSQASVARARGTTVALRELFKPLPVRRKELLRNLRREFGKLLSLLQAYAVIGTGVRLICTNQIGTGTRMKALSTQGGAGMCNNIASVFGPRTLEALMPFEASLGGIAKASGYISKGDASFGKTGSDKQYFFINGRPINVPKFVKILNDTHRSCASGLSSASRPMAFVDLRMPQANYDINLAPDKRKALIQEERALLELFQQALEEAWQPSKVSLEQPLSQAVPVDPRSQQRQQNQQEEDSSSEAPSYPGGMSDASIGSEKPQAELAPSQISLPQLSRGLSKQRGVRQVEDVCSPQRDDPLSPAQPQSPPTLEKAKMAGQVVNIAQGSMPDDVAWHEGASDSEPEASAPAVSALQHSILETQHCGNAAAPPSSTQIVLHVEQDNNPSSAGNEEAKHELMPIDPVVSEPRKRSRQEMELRSEKGFLGERCHSQQPLRSMTMRLDLEAMQASQMASQRADESRQTARFTAATLQDPAQAVSEAADRELQRAFQKEDFASMHVIGQFNLGFILARLGDNLFIIDQHAADEKYNFERLQQITRLNKQPMLQPLQLELTPAEKMTLWQEQHVFNANGFDFKELKDGQVQLTAVPFSKEAVFGPQDVHELLHLLMHGQGSAFKMQTQQPVTPSQPFLPSQAARGPSTKIIRPSRVRDMLAMRACRSSIMIGKALNRAQMQTVLVHLSHLDSPWNCPHGRPTMRHLHTLPQQ